MSNTATHTRTHAHTLKHKRVDGWDTRVQFGPDILGHYNTQLLSLITLAGTIKPRGAIAHASQVENLFSLLHGHLSPSRGPQGSRGVLLLLSEAGQLSRPEAHGF